MFLVLPFLQKLVNEKITTDSLNITVYVSLLETIVILIKEFKKENLQVEIYVTKIIKILTNYKKNLISQDEMEKLLDNLIRFHYIEIVKIFLENINVPRKILENHLLLTTWDEFKGIKIFYYNLIKFYYFTIISSSRKGVGSKYLKH